MAANDIQIGGDHYKKLKFETWDVITAWGLGYLDGTAVKYLSRWQSKGGIEDLKKARHYLDKLIEVLEQNRLEAESSAKSAWPNIERPPVRMPPVRAFVGGGGGGGSASAIDGVARGSYLMGRPEDWEGA